jgi:hypothetical protein
MSNKKTCCICYNKNTNDNLKCKTCKNQVCDECYANIVFNNCQFMPNYMENKTLFNCPFCTHENIFSTTINNYNTNNRLIQLLIIKLNENNKNYNKLVNEMNNLKECNNILLHENNILNKNINKIRLEIEYKPIKKLEKIENVIKNTKKNTILFNQINEILNK